MCQFNDKIKIMNNKILKKKMREKCLQGHVFILPEKIYMK